LFKANQNKRMKILNIIKKYIGQALFIIGSLLFVYNFFSFDWGTRYEKISYYYPDDNIRLLTVGIFLILLGFFIIREKSN